MNSRVQKPPRVQITRSHAIVRMQRRLEHESFPRIQMTLIVTLTGATGLLASFLMLRGGIESMAIRYPMALANAYLAFLFMLWLWLRTKPDDYHLDVPDFSGAPSGGSGQWSAPFSGGGGQSGGGGASGSWDATPDASVPVSSGESSMGDGVGDAVEAVAGGADELAIPLAVIALIIGLALASLYVIYIAPMLFAELAVDGALSVALYKHLRKSDDPHWLTTACKRTILPFLVTGVFLSGMGAIMSNHAPGARSVGEVIRYTPSEKPPANP